MNREFDSTIGELIVTAVDRHSSRVAFRSPDGRATTYRELGLQIAHVQKWLTTNGARHGASVAQLSANRAEIFSVMAACYLDGFKSVALSPMTGVDDLAYILEHAEVDFLVTDRTCLERSLQAASRCDRAIQIVCHDTVEAGPCLWEGLEATGRPRLVNRAAANDIVRLIYTGGTTGRPKGVMGSSGCLAMNAMLRMAGHSWAGIHLLCSTPLSHAAGAMIVPVLWHGGTAIIHDGFDPHRVVDAVVAGSANAVYVVPTMLYKLLDHKRVAEMSGRLKMIMYGAAPVSPARLREARECFGPVLTQHYGLTEAPSTILNLSESDHLDDTLLSSAGKPYPGIAVRLLNAAGDEVPVGEVGEICVRGPLLMSGYWKDPALTQACLVDGWLRSGDLAYQDPRGYFFIVDRAKDMIISGGFNVYPKEVEDVISQHPAVAAVGVIGIPDPVWGEAVKAVVVKRAGHDVDAETLMQGVRATKGPVMTPKSVDFVDQLPLTGLGKIDKKALRARYWADTSRAVN